MKNTWNEKKLKCIELLTLVNIGRGNSEAMLVTVAVAVAVADIIFPSAARCLRFSQNRDLSEL